MSHRAVKQQEAASSFYAELDVDVSYYPAIWHTYKVGQLMATDLDRVSRRHGLSMADIHLLGALRIDRSKQHSFRRHAKGEDARGARPQVQPVFGQPVSNHHRCL
jgi:hypothetical protein